MEKESVKFLEIEVTDLVTGLQHFIGENDIHELDSLSNAARVESITFGEVLVINTKITDRPHKDIKGLCELFLAHSECQSGFQFTAILVAYLINTALTSDQANTFVSEKMRIEASELSLLQNKISLEDLYKKKNSTSANVSDLIHSSIGGYQYYFAPTH